MEIKGTPFIPNTELARSQVSHSDIHKKVSELPSETMNVSQPTNNQSSTLFVQESQNMDQNTQGNNNDDSNQTMGRFIDITV